MHKYKKAVREIGIPAVTLLLVGGFWELSVRLFSIPEYLLPAPSKIWVDTTVLGWNLVHHILSTLRTIGLGFALALCISLPLAITIAYSRIMSVAIYPLLVLTQSVPKVALAPILIVVLGANDLPKIIVTFLISFFPLVISITTGLVSVPPEYVELARSVRASRVRELLSIRLPYAIPFIFSGIKVAITLAVVGAVVGEFVAAESGLGYLITSSMAFFKTPVAFGAILILALTSISLFQTVVLIEHFLFPWARPVERQR